MNLKLSLFLLFPLIYGISFSGQSLAAGELSPDTIIFNGQIFTGNATQAEVQALAIRGERISATGNNATIRALAGSQTRQVDLGGRTVIPGINDAHNHIYVVPSHTLQLSFKSEDPSWKEIRAAIVRSAKAAPKGSLLMGNFGPAIYFNPDVNRDALDKIAPNHSVILTCDTGHAVIANSAALAKVGIGEDTADPVGGRYERTADGRLTGIIREYGTLQISRRLANLTEDSDAVTQLAEFFSQAAKYGITSIQDMSEAFAPNRLVNLLAKSSSPIRLRIMRMPLTSATGRDTVEGLDVSRHPSALITVSGTKWLLDGTPDEGTLTPPKTWHELVRLSSARAWTDLPMSFPESEMELMLRETLHIHDQLLVHVSGYPATLEMLKAMQATGGPSIWLDKRVRFEHGDAIFPDLVSQVKSMGIVVVQNPTHFQTGFPVDKALPLRSLIAAGIPVALGSDGPMNPYLNIMLASSHPFRPSEAITREQAVIAYTLTSAFAEFAEQDKGSLQPGKLADLAVLSQDIFAIPNLDLQKTVSILTLVGGKIAYDAGQLH